MTVTSPLYGVGKEYEKKGVEPWFQICAPITEISAAVSYLDGMDLLDQCGIHK